MASSRSKEAIRKALLGLLLEKPLDKITVTEVVARAGVSRVTYYRAFYSLHEVIEEVLDDIFGRVEAIVPPPSPDGTPVSRRASELSTYQVLTLYKESVAFLQPLMLGSLASEAIDRMYGLMLHLTSPEPFMRSRGAEPSPADVNVASMTRIYIAAGMTAVMVDWIRGGCVTPTEDVLDFIISANASR